MSKRKVQYERQAKNQYTIEWHKAHRRRKPRKLRQADLALLLKGIKRNEPEEARQGD